MKQRKRVRPVSSAQKTQRNAPAQTTARQKPSGSSVHGTARQATERDNRTQHIRAEDRLIQIERRKARSRAFSLTVLVLLIMVVTIFAIIIVMREAAPNPRFAFIQQGELTHTVQASGLIARDETLFLAPTSGTLKPLATEGSRAARGQKLAMIIPEGKEAELAELQKCEKDIVDLQNELMRDGKGSGARAIYEESADSLASVITLLRNDLTRQELARIQDYQVSIDMILEQRTAKLMSVDFQDARLTQLRQTQSALQESLGLQAATLVCEKPGLVSYKLDGSEEQLSNAAMQTMPAAAISSLIQNSQAVLSAHSEIVQDQPVLRIASNLMQSIAVTLSGNQVAAFPLDSMHTLVIADSGLEIENCRVKRLEKLEDGTMVVFQTSHRLEWLSDRRLISLDLTVSKVTGLKVPYEALIEPDLQTKQASLMLVVEGFTRLCRVSLVDTDSKAAIIEPIDSEPYKPSTSTILVVNPGSIEAGEFIGN